MNLESQGNFEFTDESVRRGFIKKVYAILSAQLIITFAIVCIFAFIDSVRQYVYENGWVFWVSFTLSFTVLIALGCAGDLRRKTPYNFIFLFGFTIVEGIFLGSVCAYADASEVAIAIVATIAVTIGLTAFAFQTKIDFTAKSGILVCLLMVLITFSIFACIFQNTILYTFYACLGAFVFSCYIVFDTQLLLGGKHKVAVSPEEYIFASLNLYLDVVNLFVIILGISQD